MQRTCHEHRINHKRPGAGDVRVDAIADGKEGSAAETALLNAGAALWVGGKIGSLGDGIEAAREAVKQRLDAAGISIPLPQRDVHIHRADAGLKDAA